MKRFRMIDDELYAQIEAALEYASLDETAAAVAAAEALAALRAKFAPDGEGGGSLKLDAPGE